ncbi:MAG: serine/threonine-protein kinase [Deltaproteobacteria bacterium]
MPRPDPLEQRVGTTLAGKYRLERVLGAGGMGAVYAATNAWTERRVAIKVMLAGNVMTEDLVARFMREARAATRIAHENIVQILDMGQDADGSLYIVQEFLQGSDLRKLLDERRSLSARESIEILAPVMSALIAAHKQGIVHRDLKPENIFLTRSTSSSRSASRVRTTWAVPSGLATVCMDPPVAESARFTSAGSTSFPLRVPRIATPFLRQNVVMCRSVQWSSPAISLSGRQGSTPGGSASSSRRESTRSAAVSCSTCASSCATRVSIGEVVIGLPGQLPQPLCTDDRQGEIPAWQFSCTAPDRPPNHLVNTLVPSASSPRNAARVCGSTERLDG